MSWYITIVDFNNFKGQNVTNNVVINNNITVTTGVNFGSGLVLNSPLVIEPSVTEVVISGNPLFFFCKLSRGLETLWFRNNCTED